MPTPFAPRLILSHNARADLHAVLRAHSTPQALALRARIVLRAADLDRPSNLAMSREIGCDNHTVGKWRRRYLALGLSGLHDAIRSGRPKVIAAPTRVHVISVASTLPQDQERPVTRWTLEEIATTVCETLHTDPLSRSSIWRILHEVDLKPHKSEYWLNSHDTDFDAKAHAICQLYVKALEAYEHGRLVICCDEKAGMQVLERKAPTKPAQPGRRERREHEYLRHGTRVLINSLAVATGQIVIVDTLGLLLAILVTAAAADDGTAAPQVLAKLDAHTHPRLELLWADHKDDNRTLDRWLAEQQVGYRIEVVERPVGAQGFVLLHLRWVVERTFAWLGRYRRNSKDYERLTTSREATVKVSMIHLMLRRLRPDKAKQMPAFTYKRAPRKAA